MMIYLLLLSVFILSFVLTYLVKEYTKRKSIIDIPNHRSSHTVPTPRGGGLAVVIAWLAGISVLFFVNSINENLYFAFLGSIPLIIVGIIDDVADVKPVIRISVQSLSAIWALYFLGGFQVIDFGYFSFSNVYVNTFFAFFIILWFVNLFNFIDGIDGYLASGVLVFTAALFFITGNTSLLILSAAVFGFLIWNWQPAKIFMGDTGSTVLGFNFVVFAIYFQNYDKVSFLIPLIISSVFWFDATLTLIRRFLNKEKLSSPHKKHTYQRLTQAGFSHQKVAFLSIFINIIFAGVAFFAINNPDYILISFLSVILVLFFIVKTADRKKMFKSE